MKKRIVVLILLFAMSMLPVFAAGANPAMRKEYGFNSFDAVRTVSRNRTVSGRGTYVTSSYKITYIKSDKCKVVMDVWDRDDIGLFEIRKNGNALELVTDMKKYPYKSPKVKSPVADVYIYAPFFADVSLSGDNSMTVEGGEFSGKSLNVKLSGIATLSGLGGSWNNVRVGLSGVSKFTCLNLNSSVCYVDCNGSTIISGKELSVSEYLTMKLSGGSSVSFEGVKTPSFVGEFSGVSKLVASSLDSKQLKTNISGSSSVSVNVLKSDMCGGEFSGVSKFIAKDVSVNKLDATISGASNLTFTGKVAESDIELSGAATLDLAGSGSRFDVTVSSAALVRAKNFSVVNASVNLTGASQAKVTVTGNLKADVSRSAQLDYYGNPKITISNPDNVRGH